MKKNLIFKLGFIVGIFLIILSACDLGTNNKIKRANITFNLEGPAIEQVRANSKGSSSSRYIHPDASSLKFELFSGEKQLNLQTISIEREKNISITVKDVPLNDPNLRAEIEVWGTTSESAGPSLLGQNTIHLGRIGLNYTKLTLGVKPVGNDLGTATYESGENGTYLTYTEVALPTVWEIKMLSQKGLYTIEAYESGLELYDSDGRQYKNTHSIPGNKDNTLVFYHPKDEPSTYYLASSDGENIDTMSGTKLEQKILVTQYDEYDSHDKILINKENVSFTIESGNEQKFEILSFTIYNPYSQALNFTPKFENETGKDETGSPISDSTGKFKTNNFPTSLPPGGRRAFDIIFDPKESGSFFADFTIQAEGLGNFVLELSGSGSGI